MFQRNYHYLPSPHEFLSATEVEQLGNITRVYVLPSTWRIPFSWIETLGIFWSTYKWYRYVCVPSRSYKRGGIVYLTLADFRNWRKVQDAKDSSEAKENTGFIIDTYGNQGHSQVE